MDSSPEFWAYVIANVGFVVIGCLLAGLSFLAYRQHRGQRSYAFAMLGFGCVVLGGFAESVYTLWFEPDFVLTSTEFLYLQVGEDALIAIGLGLLFYAIIQHDVGSTRGGGYASSVDEDSWIRSHPYDD